MSAGREDVRPLICPRCNKPPVDFDAPPPSGAGGMDATVPASPPSLRALREETGTTCNPINSPKCWRKTPLREQKDEFDYLYAEVTGKEWKS